MSSIALSSANTRISYVLRGTNVAKLRCSNLAISYGVQGSESHAKRFRAFYPYQRVQGTFAMTFEFIGHAEYERGMEWFRDYIEAVIEQRSPSYMQVQMDSRKFVRLGYPTTGVSFGDHTGSMVFAPQITFVSVADPRDPKASIQSLNRSASHEQLPGGTSGDWFYPTSRFNQPGAIEAYLYNQAAIASAQAAADLQDVVDGIGQGVADVARGIGNVIDAIEDAI